MNVSPPGEGKKQLRILYVITKANWGGAQRYVYDLATAALQAGHEVTVACGMPGELVVRLEEAHVPVISLESMGRDIHASSDLRAFKELLDVMRAFKPDVVHSNSSKAGGMAAVAARLSGVRRIVFTAHGWAYNEERPLWQKPVIGFFHYLTVLLSDVTICVSHAMKRDARWMPFMQGRLHVIQHGIAPIEFLPRDEARAALLPTTAPLWLGTIAELHPVKQYPVILQAFERIAQQFPDAIYVIMGEGEQRARLEELIRENDLIGRVFLLGHVQDAAKYLRALDIFILASRSESFGYVVAEAGLAGLPVVASRVGALPEIINDSCGVLVPSGKSDALRSALKRLITHEQERVALGQHLRERIQKQFTMEKMISRTLALYN